MFKKRTKDFILKGNTKVSSIVDKLEGRLREAGRWPIWGFHRGAAKKKQSKLLEAGGGKSERKIAVPESRKVIKGKIQKGGKGKEAKWGGAWGWKRRRKKKSHARV